MLFRSPRESGGEVLPPNGEKHTFGGYLSPVQGLEKTNVLTKDLPDAPGGRFPKGHKTFRLPPPLPRQAEIIKEPQCIYDRDSSFHSSYREDRNRRGSSFTKISIPKVLQLWTDTLKLPVLLKKS